MDRRAEAAAQAFGRQKPEPDEPTVGEQRVREIVREELAAMAARDLAEEQ